MASIRPYFADAPAEYRAFGEREGLGQVGDSQHRSAAHRQRCRSTPGCDRDAEDTSAAPRPGEPPSARMHAALVAITDGNEHRVPPNDH